MSTTPGARSITGVDAAGDRWCAFVREADPATIEVRVLDGAASFERADAEALARWILDALERTR